ncbi:MAG TPA: DUF533 domain-containing protein [Polyangiaceae bacterium]|nr:DUF533 domain-containing protein [Polyangiaceae bacterium]
MTPGEKNIVKALIAVAWADGRIEEAESSVVEGLLVGFDASPEEERELLAYAAEPRTLARDIPSLLLERADRELLLANAALLAAADGESTSEERQMLEELAVLLELSPAEAERIIEEAVAGAPVPR